MEQDCSSAVVGENLIGTNITGFVGQYQFEDGSSQFVFLQANKADGAFGINHSLSFSTTSYVQVISSCKGLLLLSSVGDQEVNYLVFNPIFKHSVTLPQPGIKGQIIRAGLASYDGNQYRVVLVHSADTNEDNSDILFNGLELMVFSSETGRWRRLSPNNLSIPIPVPEFEFPELKTPHIFSNGAIHWEISGHLLLYWVKDDRCELAELPNLLEDWCWQSTMTYKRCFWESKGRVHYCYTDFEGVHIWTLLNEQDHDYYSHGRNYDRKRFRWALENSVNHDDLMQFRHRESYFHLGQSEPYNAYPLAIADDSEIMYLQLPGHVISYNTRTRALQEACSYTFPGIHSNCCLFFPYDYGSQFNSEIASESSESEVAELPIGEILNIVSF